MSETDKFRWAAVAAALVALIGASTTWVTVSAGIISASRTGFQQDDGYYTLIAAIVAALLLKLVRAQWATVIAGICGIGIFGVAVYDAQDWLRKSGTRSSGSLSLHVDVSLGIGMWLTGLAGVAFIVIAVMLLRAGTSVVESDAPPPLSAC